MSIETTENVESTNVVEETQKPHTGTPETPLTKEQQLENDNWKQREAIRKYKEEVESLRGTVTTLETGLNEIRTSLTAKEQAEQQATRDKAIETALSEAGVTDDKAKTLAIKMLGNEEDIATALKQVIEDYPFIVGKKTIVLPNTGKAQSEDNHIPDNRRLSSGLAALINK